MSKSSQDGRGRSKGGPRARPLLCAEGCGCELSDGSAVIRWIDGRRLMFCCADCADSLEERKAPEIRRTLNRWVRPGCVVWDVGCGRSGWALELARRVGPGGSVLLSDPQRSAVRWNVDRLHAALPSIEVRGVATSSIPAASVDFAFVNDVLCCARAPERLFRRISRSLRPGGVAYLRITRPRSPSVQPITSAQWRRWLGSGQVRVEGSANGIRWAVWAPTPKNRPGAVSRRRRGMLRTRQAKASPPPVGLVPFPDRSSV
jgi:SAM-dependent methyltransferase